jgi:hypothetical protein
MSERKKGKCTGIPILAPIDIEVTSTHAGN